MPKPIKLIACDLDGTLLNSQHVMSARNEQALKQAMAQGVQVVIITGKTQASAKDIIERLQLTTPGIYNQGLTVYNGDGTLRMQKMLEPLIARQVLDFGEERGFSMVAYSGNRILVREINADVRQLTDLYHEPEPEAVGAIQDILEKIPANKLLAITRGEIERINVLRGQLSGQLNGQAQLMQALPDALEILPPGASKGATLAEVLRQMGITPNHILAIGDGENDLASLSLAGLGVAMGNATSKLKDVADAVVGSNDDDGVAEAIERFVLSN
jgi:Cof subfamily protein (haloacid dehalogenase superfamily)